MTKKQEAMEKAKQSGKKTLKGGKDMLIGARDVLGGTVGALGYTLLSALEKGGEIAIKPGGGDEGLMPDEQEKFDKMARKYSKKSKEHINKAGKQGIKALKGIKETIEGLLKLLGYGANATYNLFDAGDKAIGEKIEKKQLKEGREPGEIGKFIRDNIVKLAIALSVLGFGGYEVKKMEEVNKEQDKIGIVDRQQDDQQGVQQGGQEIKSDTGIEIEPGNNQIVKAFFDSPDVLKDLKSSGKEYEDYWIKRYLGENDEWKNGSLYGGTRGVLDGICRMIKDGHLKMVIEKADAMGVPRQCVFLALAESCWKKGADSGKARGFWQFTRDTARRYKLIDKKGNDYRSDPGKSTDAAMQHLNDNYKAVCKYAKELGYNLSESDKWIFAFYMYNGSPALVKIGMKACKGNVNEYSEKLKEFVDKNGGYIIVRGKKKKVDADENGNYVPRILAIQNALQKIFKENGYDVDKIRSIYLEQNFIKTNADLMHQDFVKNEKNMSNKEKVKKLKEIKAQYTEEYNLKKISKTYYEGAIRIINNEISSFE